MIILTESSVFVDPLDGSVSGVHQIPDTHSEMVPLEYYVLGAHVYEYIGAVNSRVATPEGTIYTMNNQFYVNEYKDPELMDRFGEENITTRQKYEAKMDWKNRSIDDIADAYLNEHDTNLVEVNRNKLANTGDVYIPDLSDTDDPMERVIKLMVISMKLKLNERRSSFSEEYGLDNLRSALNGATKNMSISKFLIWCNLLGLDWEFTLINSNDGIPNPLPEPVTISNHKTIEEDIPEEMKKGIFNVPLEEGEDPLKRLIKVAIFKKVVYLKDYKDKGTTAHLINNMRSGLKGKQKMSILCALNWCEILDMILIIKVTNPTNGIWYKSVGYDVYTNVADDENAIYVDEKG